MKRIALALGLAAVLGTAGCLNVAPTVSPSVKVGKDTKKRIEDLERRMDALEQRVDAMQPATPTP